MRKWTLWIAVSSFTFVAGTIITVLWWTARHPTEKKNSVPVFTAAKFESVHADPAPDTQRHTITFYIEGSEYLKAVEFISHDQEYPLYETRSEEISNRASSVDLDLAESLWNQIIILQAHPGKSGEFRVEQRYETSMTVVGEGPHVDLLNWKHYISGWKEIEKRGSNEFLTLNLSEIERSKFPQVTRKEMYDAVATETASDQTERNWWLREVRKCKSPTDDPCAVTVSKISFRIKTKERGVWKVVKRLDFMIPMGC